ncbi:MAG: NADH-quinone oxidoreductase subunit L [Bacteriovoracia bacterium]
MMLALPLIGFLINGLWYLSSIYRPGSSEHGHADSHGASHEHDGHSHHEDSNKAIIAGAIASAAIFGSFIISLMKFSELSGSFESMPLEETLFQWITISGSFNLPFTLRFDALTAIMCLVITGVGTLIHVYSIGYMSHDKSPGKFFAYLNLFTFSMLSLVLGGSLPILFLGWEGVGLCSYLLIGYWYEDQQKASAGKKAFIVNRVGDFGFLLGIFLIFNLFGTLDFESLKTAVSTMPADAAMITLATSFLFIGAMGKSAQIPLYVWLPDAMAGPTPVSALIHAATMVTAGVYMIARLNFLFSLAPSTMVLISSIGGLTALFAATIAITQRDIKKVLAYSTVSQLGYMFMAVGVGAYVAGVFHLVTHAFFKALLFLGSGSVIHGMHEEQDIMKMGGLSKHMPKTNITFLIGTIAIAGIPPLAGFFSKDEILWNAYSSHVGAAGFVLWAVGAITALLTAFYMTRLYCLTFLGEERFDKKKVAVHESPNVMVVPLMVLGFLSVVGGFIGFPGHSWLAHWLAPVVGEHVEAHDAMEYVLMFVSVLIAASGVGLGYYFYVVNKAIPKKIYDSAGVIYKLLWNKYYIDEIYELLIVKPTQKIAQLCWKIFDVRIVDGFVISIARVSRFTGEVIRLAQTGAVQVYAAFILGAMLLLMGYLIYGLR